MWRHLKNGNLFSPGLFLPYLKTRGPWERGWENGFPSIFPTISILIGYYAMRSKNLQNAWFNLSILILPPDFETVHALCVRAILSVGKSGHDLSTKQFSLLRIIFWVKITNWHNVVAFFNTQPKPRLKKVYLFWELSKICVRLVRTSSSEGNTETGISN